MSVREQNAKTEKAMRGKAAARDAAREAAHEGMHRHLQRAANEEGRRSANCMRCGKRMEPEAQP